MKNLALFFILIAFQVRAQDTISFVNGNISAVKVAEIGLKEIKYNRFDNVTGPVYVIDKSEIKYIKYANGSVDSFNVKKSVVVETTPAYVDIKPTENSFEKIIIVRKRLYYQHHSLNEKGLLELVKNHPDPKTKSVMLREFTKIRTYKNNRLIGFGVLTAGIICQLASGSGINGAATFLLGGAAGITGCVIATINKNKRYRKRIDIARIYNGDFLPNEKEHNFK